MLHISSESYQFNSPSSHHSEDDYFHLKISRRFTYALALSLAIHGVILLFRWLEVFPEQGQENVPITFDVALAPATPPSPTPAPLIAPPEPPPPVKTPPLKPIQRSPILEKRPLLSTPKANPNFSVPSLPQEPLRQAPPAEVPTSPALPPESPPVTDMMSYVNAARARRRAAGDPGLANEEAIAKQRAPSQEEVRNAIIARNLQAEGQNGLFTILSKDDRYARFSYRGWTSDFNAAKQEIIDVDAGANGNVEEAIIKRMIQIIRQHYKEDFNWHSQRLGRVIVLSARLEDTEGLQDFLKRELFGGKGTPIPY